MARINQFFVGAIALFCATASLHFPAAAGFPQNGDLLKKMHFRFFKKENAVDKAAVTKYEPFDHFTFTQQWPPTACRNAGHHRCVIPSGVSTWTLHGLWPTNGATHGPGFCNSSWHFDDSKIKDLEPEMNIFWPNLFADTSHVSLWSHEWTKHGTCAAAEPALRGEHNYFGGSLKLRERFPLSEILAQRGIRPHPTIAYNTSSVLTVIKQFPELKGKNVGLYCAFSSHKRSEENEVFAYKTKRQYLFQIEICLNRQFEPIDCVETGSCSLTRPIYYPPIPNKAHFFSFLNNFDKSHMIL